MSRSLIVFLFYIFNFSISYCQQPNDSIRYETLLAKAKEWMNKDATQGKFYLDSLYKEHIINNPSDHFTAAYQKYMGIYYYRQADYDSSLYYYKKASLLYKQIDLPLEQAKITINTAMVFNKLALYDSTILYSRKAHKIFTELGDAKGIGISLNIIGQIFYFNKDYLKAKEYFHSYLNNAIEASDTTEIASGFTNLAGVSNDLQQYDSSLYFYQHGLKMAKKINNQYSIGNGLQNIAITHQELGNNKLAHAYYDSAMLVYKNIDFESGLLEVSLNMGKNYNNQKQPALAVRHLSKALELARKNKEHNMEIEALHSLSIAYEQIGNFRLSYDALKAYKNLSDSVFNAENRKNIEEINTKYETDIKDQRIVLLDQENKIEKAANQRNYIVIGALVLVMILIVVIFILWRNRIRIKQKQVLNEQKIRMREAQINAVINSEEKERKRFAADLHDGMGQLVATLNINIESLKAQSSNHDKRDEIFDNANQLLSDIQKEIRNIAFNLMPQILTKEGLIAAIQELTKRINKSQAIKATMQVHGIDKRLNEVYEISLYRILQEWISNILKYAQANAIFIQFTAHESEIVITVEDNGQGFDLQKFENSRGNGWKNINTRLNLINGKLEIDTLVGRKNTTLTIFVNNKEALKSNSLDKNTEHTVLN